MVDVLSNLFNYSHVATVRSTDSYGMNGISAFSSLWTSQNRTILTSQSFSSGETDFSLVYHEIQRVRARVIVLFCQARDAAASFAVRTRPACQETAGLCSAAMR